MLNNKTDPKHILKCGFGSSNGENHRYKITCFYHKTYCDRADMLIRPYGVGFYLLFNFITQQK